MLRDANYIQIFLLNEVVTCNKVILEKHVWKKKCKYYFTDYHMHSRRFIQPERIYLKEVNVFQGIVEKLWSIVEENWEKWSSRTMGFLWFTLRNGEIINKFLESILFEVWTYKISDCKKE